MFLVRAGTEGARERGSALVAVIGIAALMMIVSVMIAGMSVNALGFTSSTRAGLQSKTAAESGVSAAVVALRNGTCSVNYSQTTAAPSYSVSVSYSTAVSGDTWVANTCPPVADQSVKRVKIVSTGYASAPGAAGVSSANSATVESVFPFTPATRPGAAMYFYGGVAFDNNGNLIVAAGGPPAIQVANGNVSCANNTVIQGDVVLGNGDLSINSCTIQGNAWVNGTATLGNVTGNLSAHNPTRPGGVSGTYTVNGAVPTVPNWVAFGYNPASWVDSSGNPYKVLSIGAGCALDVPMMNAVAATGTTPVIINALACTSGVTASATLSLPNDLVVFSPMFNLSGSNNLLVTSSSAQQRRVWFITPDITGTNPPSCGAAQGNFTINNKFDIGPTVSAMLYTPCQFVAKNTFTWRGQIYANGSLNSFKNNTAFTYVGLGLPGVDLGSGSTASGSGGTVSTLKTMTSMRDVKLGG